MINKSASEIAVLESNSDYTQRDRLLNKKKQYFKFKISRRRNWSQHVGIMERDRLLRTAKGKKPGRKEIWTDHGRDRHRIGSRRRQKHLSKCRSRTYVKK